MRFRLFDWALFLREYLQNPKLVASVFPSSETLGDALIHYAGAEEANTIVELGSGTGVITERVLKKKKDSSTFFAVEISESLAEATRKRCPDVEVIYGDARYLKGMLVGKGLSTCDSIVSCVPWATLPKETQNAMIDAVVESLAPGGRFATLLLLPGLHLPSTRRFKRRLEERFERVGVSTVVWRNLPPAVVLWAEKSR